MDETGAPRETPVHQESEEAGESIKDLVVSSNKQIVETDGSPFFYQTTARTTGRMLCQREHGTFILLFAQTGSCLI